MLPSKPNLNRLAMRVIALAILLVFLSTSVQSQPVGIGTTTPHPSAALDITSTTGGLLIPRMNSSQRDAIALPTKGLIIFNTTDSSLYYFDGYWQKLIPASSAWSLKGNNIPADSMYFIGTTNNSTFRVKVNNELSGLIDSTRRNSAWGYMALSSNTTGRSNTAIGFKSLGANLTGDANVSIGQWSLSSNTTGFYNTSVGVISMLANTEGSANVALGAETLMNNKTGTHNTAVGVSALFDNWFGSNNTAVGHGAMWNNYDGNYNTAIGSNAFLTWAASNSTAIGANAWVDASNKIVLGDTNVTKVQTKAVHIATGYSSALSTAQILSLTNLIEGTIIYNSTTKKPVYYDGVKWKYFNDSEIAVNIGDHIGGGIVFYVDASGQHGLMAAEADMAAIPWSNGTSILTGANSATDGLSNTTLLNSTYGQTSFYAARICKEYFGGGISGWFLPSKDQLNQLYLQKNIIGGFSNSNYWSSTEADTNNAWVQDFGAGSQGTSIKTVGVAIRAIRSF